MISVIIPVYNRADRINRTIDNIFEQSYNDLEVIVVDDGSSDEIEIALSPYLKKKNFSFVRSDKNYGACHARNAGVNLAKGEYIAFQDSDDLWHKNKLEEQLVFLKENKADICICGMQNVYEDGHTTRFHKEGFSQKDITLENELASSFFSTQLIIGKRECFVQEPFDERFPRFQDWDLGIRLVKKFCVVYLDKVLVDRLVQGDSLSHNKEKGYIAGKLLLEKYRNEYQKYPKAEARFLEFYAQFQEAVGESSRKNLFRSLKQEFRVKTLAKLILQLFGLYGKKDKTKG